MWVITFPLLFRKSKVGHKCIFQSLFFFFFWSSHRDMMETNPTKNHEVEGSIPGLAQQIKESGIAVSCAVGHRLGSDDLVLLWPEAVTLI